MAANSLGFDLEELVSGAPLDSEGIRCGAAPASCSCAGMVATFPQELSTAARLEQLSEFLAECEGVLKQRGVPAEAANQAELIRVFDARSGDAILLFRFPMGEPAGLKESWRAGAQGLEH